MSTDRNSYLLCGCRLPGSDLLLGLPVVLDTNSENIKEGQRVSVVSGSQLPIDLGHLHGIRGNACPRKATTGLCDLLCICAALHNPMQVLLTYKGQDLAVLEVESKWVPNKTLETKLCYGTTSLEHPGTLMVATERGKYYLGGKVFGLDIPQR